MHLSSMESCERFRDKYCSSFFSPQKVVDVGSFDVNGSYEFLFQIPQFIYYGLDVQAGPNVNFVVGEEEQWGATLGPFDIIISGQCLEHVRRPWKWIHQVASLARPGTLLFITLPNTWGFHEYPIDCWRAFPDGLAALMQDGGFEVLEAYMTGENLYDTVGIGIYRGKEQD